MARTHSVRACALLIVIVLVCESFSSEGRTFVTEKSKFCKECRGQGNQRAPEASTVQSLARDNSVVNVLADSRPTTPGHSPGVGHVRDDKNGDNDK